MCVYMEVQVCAYMYVSVRACELAYVCVYMSVCMCGSNECPCVSMRVCVRVCPCVSIRIDDGDCDLQ
jgi:hypothetical protein